MLNAPRPVDGALTKRKGNSGSLARGIPLRPSSFHLVLLFGRRAAKIAIPEKNENEATK